MKTGIVSTAYFDTYDYENGFAQLRAHGYGCTDYNALMSIVSPLYGLSGDELRAFLTGVRDSARAHGMEINQMHALWGTVNDDKTEEDRQKTTEFFVRDIEAAHALGCPNLVLHPLLPFGHDVEGDYGFTFERNVKLLRDLIPHAEKWGVTLCVENLPFKSNPISKISEVKRLIRLIDHPLVGICLDTGHANIFSNDLAADVRFIGDDLKVMHVHDNQGWCDAHLLPWCGTIKWEPFLAALAEIGFDGCLSLETSAGSRMPEPCRTEMRISLAKLARSMADSVNKK